MFVVDEIAAYLRANGITKVYECAMPDSPDKCVAVYEYAGFAPNFGHDGQHWENPHIQCLSRAPTYPDARQQAQQVYNLLNGQTNVVINGGNYLSIKALQNPFAILPDENQRDRVVINFELARGTEVPPSSPLYSAGLYGQGEYE
jgi:Bacteriophage minor capsid protein